MYTREDVKKYQEAESAFCDQQEKLVDRVNEVIKVFCKFFNAIIDTWYFSNASEGEVGTCNLNISDEDEISIEICFNSGSDITQFKLSYNGWDYNQGFPKKFLFMSEEEIVKYLTEEKVQQSKDEKKKKDKIKIAAEIRKKKKQEALSQLTSEQIEVLGLG